MLRASWWSTVLTDVDAVLDRRRSLRLADHVEASRFLTHRDHLAALQKVLDHGGQKGPLEAFESDQLKSVTTMK
jgi:hypothetical protein